MNPSVVMASNPWSPQGTGSQRRIDSATEIGPGLLGLSPVRALPRLLDVIRAGRGELRPACGPGVRPRPPAETPIHSSSSFAPGRDTARERDSLATRRCGDAARGQSRRVAGGGLLVTLLLWLILPTTRLHAQELEPRAYVPAPVGLNLLLAADNVSSGDLSFDPSLPITQAHANLNAAVAGYFRTINFFGRSANAGIAVPYIRGDVSGVYLGQPVSAHRSDFGDPRLRLAVNLYGAPAMTPREYAAFHEETIVGASLYVVPPLGSYDSTKLVNVGSNRWSFKPEIGASHAIGPWRLEADIGGWFFTDNSNFWNGKLRQQDPIGSLQLHAIYTFRQGLWIAVDGNYYTGGRTTIDGKENFDLQKNSRVGVTLALPITRQQSIKIAYSVGARTTVGGDFQTIGVSYQYGWMDRP
jgi:hypothetical protein